MWAQVVRPSTDRQRIGATYYVERLSYVVEVLDRPIYALIVFFEADWLRSDRRYLPMWKADCLSDIRLLGLLLCAAFKYGP
jgi:hypothetical protein